MKYYLIIPVVLIAVIGLTILFNKAETETYTAPLLSEEEKVAKEWVRNVELEEEQKSKVDALRMERDEYLLAKEKEILKELKILSERQTATTDSLKKMIGHSGLASSTGEELEAK